MKKVLIVDDSETFLELIDFMLKKDFDLAFAKSATEAIKLVKSNNYDGIILDMSLPDYTGYYLGNSIRKIDSNVPMAFLTNYGGKSSRETADLLKAKFWYKPTIINEKNALIESVKNLCLNETK